MRRFLPVQVVLAEAEAAAEAKRQRRAVVAAEKAAAQPPRLGKHKFEPEAVQVRFGDVFECALVCTEIVL